MVEIWKDCFGFEDIAMISSKGSIYRKEREVNNNGGVRIVGGELAKTFIAGSGYEYVKFSKDGKYKNRRVHRLVLQTFNPIDNYDDMTVNHKDGNKLNNDLSNLEWMTHKENIRHGWETGLMTAPERTLKKLTLRCEECNSEYETTDVASKYCSYDCVGMANRVVKDRPSKEELYSLLLENTFTRVGELFSVSDNTIRKWCRAYEIPSKSEFYRDKGVSLSSILSDNERPPRRENAKLSDNDVRRIRERHIPHKRKGNGTTKNLAIEFDVSERTIRDIVNRNNYKDVY